MRRNDQLSIDGVRRKCRVGADLVSNTLARRIAQLRRCRVRDAGEPILKGGRVHVFVDTRQGQLQQCVRCVVCSVVTSEQRDQRGCGHCCWMRLVADIDEWHPA